MQSTGMLVLACAGKSIGPSRLECPFSLLFLQQQRLVFVKISNSFDPNK